MSHHVCNIIVHYITYGKTRLGRSQIVNGACGVGEEFLKNSMGQLFDSKRINLLHQHILEHEYPGVEQAGNLIYDIRNSGSPVL